MFCVLWCISQISTFNADERWNVGFLLLLPSEDFLHNVCTRNHSETLQLASDDSPRLQSEQILYVVPIKQNENLVMCLCRRMQCLISSPAGIARNGAGALSRMRDVYYRLRGISCEMHQECWSTDTYLIWLSKHGANRCTCHWAFLRCPKLSPTYVIQNATWAFA